MKYFQLVIIFLIASSSFSQSIVAEEICIENPALTIKSRNTSYDSENIFHLLFNNDKYLKFNVRGLPENLGSVSKFKVHILDSNNVKCEYWSLYKGNCFLGGEKVKKTRKSKNKSGMKRNGKHVMITSRLRHQDTGPYSCAGYGFRLSPGIYKMYVDFMIDGQQKRTRDVSLIVL